MAIDSVSSAVSATVQPPPQNREIQRPEATETQAAERPETRRAERQEPVQAQQQEDRSRPVVNTEGQMTGTRINTTA